MRRLANGHFNRGDSERPDIRLAVVFGFAQDFRLHARIRMTDCNSETKVHTAIQYGVPMTVRRFEIVLGSWAETPKSANVKVTLLNSLGHALLILPQTAYRVCSFPRNSVGGCQI